MVEVFVPTWNSVQTIARCLASIYAAIPNAEVVLVDRYSHDGTVKIPKDYGAEIRQGDLNLGRAREAIDFSVVGSGAFKL